MKSLASLLIGSVLLCSCVKKNEVTVSVQNTADFERQEMVEVAWSLIENNLKMGETQQIVVLDEQGQQVPYQLVTYGEKKPKLLIFPASFDAKQKLAFKVTTGEPEKFEDQVKATFVPQRKDDMSWENDRAAFRMYGPALEVDSIEHLISGGIDIWVKKTPKLVTQRWYKEDLAKIRSYHEDHGEGLDFFSVGTSLGAGAAAPFYQDTLYAISHNFTSYEILDNGPLRTVFRLTYEPYQIMEGITVNETRTISLDAGSNLNKIVEDYGTLPHEIQIAAGFPYYNNDTYVLNAGDGYISYAQPENPEHGIIYLGMVSDVSLVGTKILGNELLGLMNYQPSYSSAKGLTYYSGGGWNQGGFPTFQDWTKYVSDFAKGIRNPLLVSVN